MHVVKFKQHLQHGMIINESLGIICSTIQKICGHLHQEISYFAFEQNNYILETYLNLTS